MTSFIVIALLITCLVLGLLFVPLLRTRNTLSYERHAQNIHYAKERLQELEDQLKNASISATDYEALKLEIETTLAHDIDLADQASHAETTLPRRSNKFAISMLGVFIPLAAVGFYLISGTPEMLSPARTTERPSAEQINQLIQDIEQKLAQNPDDLTGWTLLSRTYLSLGRFREARDGYIKVLELGGESAPTYASLADASALLANGEITSEAAEYIQKALALDPNSQQALWLAGLGAMQQGNKEQASSYWQRLLNLLDDLPEQQQELRQIMAESLGENNTNQTAGSDAAIAVALKVEVNLSEELTKQANPDDIVFVFAKAKQGPPAPLAVKRLTVADLPATLVLNDNDAMVSQLKLSAFEDVVISARVSKSGQPVAQAGDLQSNQVDTKNTSPENITLVISQIVE